MTLYDEIKSSKRIFWRVEQVRHFSDYREHLKRLLNEGVIVFKNGVNDYIIHKVK